MPGGDPFVVRVGTTTFALRRREVETVWVEVDPPTPAMNAAVGSAEGLSLSLIGVPNCGKTALFNRLTGSRQKVANYPGVTVERKEGRFIGPPQRPHLPPARSARRLQPRSHEPR